MNILLTNDDGINAEGIEILAKALIKEGHKITIAAPNVENSGKSHAITFKSPLMVQETKLEGLEDVNLKRLQVLNINVPYLDYQELKGVEVCKVGADVMSIYDISEEGEGYNMRLKGFPKDNNEKDSDIHFLGQGYATVSPLLYDVTNLTLINELSQMLK